MGMSHVEKHELGVYRSEVAEFDHGGSNRKCEFEACELFPCMCSRIFLSGEMGLTVIIQIQRDPKA